MHDNGTNPRPRDRLQIAFFDYPDVFEDFYTHYGVDQHAFSTTWQNTANHMRISLIQKEIGDVVWYVTSLQPQIQKTTCHAAGFNVKFLPSSWLHRQIWKLFYSSNFFCRWQRAYRYYATTASYLAPLSLSLITALYKDRPDIIFVQDYCSGRYDILLLLAKCFRIRLATIHTGSTPEHYLGKWLKPFTIARADWIFASGIKERDRLKAVYGIHHEQINIIRAPIDMSVFKVLDKNHACAKMKIDPDRRYFLYVGRLDNNIKRISAILSTFGPLSTKYPDIDLLIIGSGKDEMLLKKQARKLSPQRVQFLGWLSDPKRKAEAYNVAECLILASLREGFPAVIGEALSCGLPVVSSDVGSISDVIIEDRTGWLIPQGNDEAMGHRLSYIAKNPEIIKSIRPGIREFAEEFLSLNTAINALKEGFTSLTKNHDS